MENFDLDSPQEKSGTRTAATITAAVTAISWMFLPVSQLTGVSSWGWAERAYIPHAGLELLLTAGIFLFGVFFFLVFPTVHLIYNEANERFQGLARVVFVTLLLSLPLISFSYYLGHIREALDYTETGLFLFVPLFTQVLLYERFRSPVVLTLGLFVGFFLPLFVVNDLMGPFKAFVNYAPLDMTLYFMHRGFAVAAVGYALVRCHAVLRLPTRISYQEL